MMGCAPVLSIAAFTNTVSIDLLRRRGVCVLVAAAAAVVVFDDEEGRRRREAGVEGELEVESTRGGSPGSGLLLILLSPTPSPASLSSSSSIGACLVMILAPQLSCICPKTCNRTSGNQSLSASMSSLAAVPFVVFVVVDLLDLMGGRKSDGRRMNFGSGSWKGGSEDEVKRREVSSGLPHSRPCRWRSRMP